MSLYWARRVKGDCWRCGRPINPKHTLVVTVQVGVHSMKQARTQLLGAMEAGRIRVLDVSKPKMRCTCIACTKAWAKR